MSQRQQKKAVDFSYFQYFMNTSVESLCPNYLFGFVQNEIVTMAKGHDTVNI